MNRPSEPRNDSGAGREPFDEPPDFEQRARNLPKRGGNRRGSNKPGRTPTRKTSAANSPDPARQKKRRRLLLIGLLGLALLVGIPCAVVAGYYNHLASDYDLDRVGAMPERSVVLDRNGHELGRLHGQNRIIIGLDQVPAGFIEALLIREDASFRKHGGIDPRGLLRAFARNLRDREMTQGASTITMQLARNSFGMQEKTLHRKFIEMALARRIEKAYSKDEILTNYINRIFFGSGIYGLERASRAYFGKPAAGMTLSESAMIAGIIRSPNRFSPFHNPSGALSERDTVLDRMVIVGVIDATDAEIAKAEPLTLRPVEATTNQESWALDAVRRDLDRVLDDRHFDDGGLRIHTTFDAGLQRQAEAALDTRLREFESRTGHSGITKEEFDRGWAPSKEDPYPKATPYLQGSLVMLDNQTGGVLALVGGRDFSQSVFNRALLASRQIGSTFKPFVYAAAFEVGLLPGTLVSDDPITPGEVAGLGNWSPRNSDNTFTGWQPAHVGLVRSRNTMTVRVGTLAGLERVCELSLKLNLKPPTDPDLQLFIGNTGATLHELTSAFSVFPTDGIRRRPHVITRIEDSSGRLIYDNPMLEYRAMAEAPARMTREVLEQVLQPGGTAAAARADGFTTPAGGKTGTTNNFHDAWFVGFTSRLTCGVWVGFDQPASIGSGAYGSRLALPVWVDAMQAAEDIGWTSEPGKTSPVPMQTVEVCRQTGRLATTACRARGDAYSIELPFEMIPRDFCQLPADDSFSPTQPAIDSPGFWRRLGRWFGD